MLTFGEEWQKVLASPTRPLLQQGLARKYPIHNCRPIIFASSCTATTNWFMNNFSSNCGGTLCTTCDTVRCNGNTSPIVSRFQKQALYSEQNQPPSSLTSLGYTKIVSPQRLCQGPGYPTCIHHVYIWMFIFWFSAFHLHCLPAFFVCVPDHIHMKAISRFNKAACFSFYIRDNNRGWVFTSTVWCIYLPSLTLISLHIYHIIQAEHEGIHLYLYLIRR